MAFFDKWSFTYAESTPTLYPTFRPVRKIQILGSNEDCIATISHDDALMMETTLLYSPCDVFTRCAGSAKMKEKTCADCAVRDAK